jgi:hypothetical protein
LLTPSNVTQYPLRVLFDCLGVHAVTTCFEWILCERKILFTSSQRTLLTLACDAVCSLLYPFQWNFVFIPILPVSLFEFLEAPTPFVVGIQQDQFHLIDLQILNVRLCLISFALIRCW